MLPCAGHALRTLHAELGDGATRRAQVRYCSWPCERCESDVYPLAAQGEAWPHWQQHSLGDLMIELRFCLIDDHLDHRHAGVPMREYLWGRLGNAVHERDENAVDAIADIDEFVRFIDLRMLMRLASLMPKSSAICCNVACASRSRATATTASQNSCGYGAGMETASPPGSSPQK